MPPRRRWTLPAAAAAAMVMTPSANAEDFAISPGLFVQLSFGADWNLGIGFDLRGAWLAESASCFEDTRQSGVGLYAQSVFFFRDGGLLLGAGLHGGVQPRRSGPAWDAELGWMWRTATALTAGGHGLQLGLTASQVPFDGALRFSLYHDDEGWVPEGHLAGGGRIPGVFGADGSFCVEGRPQRASEAPGLVAAGEAIMGRVFVRPTARRRPRRFARTATRRALGIAWAEAARAEAASVPAFLGLARDLQSVGAPRRMVEQALEAAADEVRHARDCSAVAGRFLGAEVAVEVPAVAPTAGENRVALLRRLAAEALRDGCIGEGAAAARARLGARRAGTTRLRRVLGAIAVEESRHAALAADVVGFCRAVGGEAVEEALMAVAKALFDAPPNEVPVPAGISARAWQRGGRVTAEEARRLEAEALSSRLEMALPTPAMDRELAEFRATLIQRTRAAVAGPLDRAMTEMFPPMPRRP